MITEENLESASGSNDDSDSIFNEPGPLKPGHIRRNIIWLQAIAFVLGLALLVYVIRRVGVQPIFDALSRIGLGFFIILLINGLRHVFRTVAMSLSIAP